MVKRVYSDSQVAEALAVVDAYGGDVLRASQTTGVPRKTLEGWANGRVQRVSAPDVVNDMTEVRKEKRGQLRRWNKLPGNSRRRFKARSMTLRLTKSR